MLYRTGIKLTLALIVALIAVVARAGGGDPRLPPWPYENDPRMPSNANTGAYGMFCEYIFARITGYPREDFSKAQLHSVGIFPPHTGYIPPQWCDNRVLAKWREPNCLRSICTGRAMCLLCTSPILQGTPDPTLYAYVADNGCLRCRCTRMGRHHP